MATFEVWNPERKPFARPRNGETVPPPNSMPGYCVAIPTPDQPDDEAVRSAIVVEMGWAESEDSLSYIHAVPFGVGARILYALQPYQAVAQLDGGYVVLPLPLVMAWTPGEVA